MANKKKKKKEYIILDHIKTGGFGTISRALQHIHGLERLVVVKKIKPEIINNPDLKESFIDEKVFNKDGLLDGITVLKGNNDPSNSDKDDHEVDAISGSTITGDGVTDMIKERLNNYLPFLKKLEIAQL